MRPMGGEVLIKALRQMSKVPAILITATAGRGASSFAGANAFLAKPFTELDLEATIKRAFFIR